MDARARTPIPPSSTSLCPACGKAIDVLRAGHVAILDGAFRYFCDASCKGAYVDTSSKRPTLDAITAEPPTVVVSGVREHEAPSFPVPPVRSEVAAKVFARDAFAEESFVEPPLSGGFAPAPPPHRGFSLRSNSPTAFAGAPSSRREPQPELEADEDEDPHEEVTSEELEEAPNDEAPREDVPPATLRSPLSSSTNEITAAAPPAEPEPSREPTHGGGMLEVLTFLGIGAGVLSAVVVLAGESAGALRLPLALVAALVVLARVALRPREPSEVSPWVVAVPITVAASAAGASRFLHDGHADGHAAFVGIAAAAALTSELMASRARRDVVDARARTASALAVRARVVRGEMTSEIDATQVKPGEQVVVETNEMVSVDGIVAAGRAEIAPWLDSPVVVEKREGDAVVAGATVASGRLRVNATFSGAERAWLRLAQSSSGRVDVAAPLVSLARRAIERGAPASGLIVAIAAYANNGSWLDVALAASAGGFALAASAAAAAAALAHARGHAAAQRRGIVYKDAAAFDGAARADIAVVCSRGTVLLGEPEIVAMEAIDKSRRTEDDGEVARVLALAAGAELASSHPFAAAVLRAARARHVRPENVRSALVHHGLGVTALAPNGDKVIVGSRAFLLKERVSVAIADARVSELEAQGRSVLLVALGERLIGLLALQDGLRPGARAAVQRLHDARIEPVLLSGEARETCETIARSLDIEHVRPEILPADRGAEVRALADGGHVVAAIGHAASDDGALGAADVSVAMGAAGAAPGEWSVALASDDVRDAALALTIPRACRERAKTSIIVGASAQALSALGIIFGIAPPQLAPILGVLATVAAFAIVREPTTLPSRR